MKFLTLFVILWVPSLIYGQNETRRCGLPENITQYPDFAQEEIKSVWKTYVPGTKCDKELLIMDDILTVLDMFDTEVPGGLSTISTQQQTTNTVPFSESTTTFKSETTTTNFEKSVSQTLPVTFFSKTMIPEETTTDKSPVTLLENSSETAIPSSNIPEPNPIQKNFVQPTNEDDYEEDNIERVPLYEMEVELPFLAGATKKVIKAFYNVVNDPDIPSEGRRQELIHVLAVSYLDDNQLRRFNSWSTAKRKRIAAREQQLRDLSFKARDKLKQLSLMDSSRQKDAVEKLPLTIKRELRNYAKKLVAQRHS